MLKITQEWSPHIHYFGDEMPTTRRQCKNSGRKSTEYEQLEVSYQHTICTGVSQWCKSSMMTVKVKFSINTIELKVKFLYNHLNAAGICLRTSFNFKIRTNHRPQKWDGNTYIFLDGLSYNTRGYFASCVVFFQAPQGRGKMRAMSKMSASIIW